MKAIRALAAAAATVLAAGCSSPAGSDPSPAPATAPSSAPVAPPSSAPAGPEPTALPPADGSPSADAAATRWLSAADLQAVLLAVRAQRGLDARLIEAAELEAQADAARAALLAADIRPAACAELAANEASAVPDGGSLALLAVTGTPDGVDTLAVASHPDPAVLAGLQDTAARLLEECSTFTMTFGGSTVTTTAASAPVPDALPGAAAVRTVSEGAGQRLETLSVSSVRGHHRVQVSVTSPADPAAAVAHAAELIEAVHTELQRLP
ncbi:hypothetical protein BN1051_00961 [Arthrobacter saudimassiliensis]|uniref:Lipoprotein n=1 Tax=Arthrobacter saudimassiliensis TaxID=1461584 RepID=A0A078MS59_9MICC|nr:hypothetical protein BN1051_00961 [Arthrobacter saudimassiliensis]